MKRWLISAAVVAGSLFWASPASAEPTPVQQTQSTSSYASAVWLIDGDVTDGRGSFTGVSVSHSQSGTTELMAYSTTTEYFLECEDICRWEPLHHTMTRVNVTSGFTFSLPQSLERATVSGSGLPAEICELDEDGGLEGPCEPTTVSLSATWVGTGETSRDVTTFHDGPPASPDLVVNSHGIDVWREATATGSFNDQKLGTTNQAVLGGQKNGSVCVNCP
jgi:hypothetical protein